MKHHAYLRAQQRQVFFFVINIAPFNHNFTAGLAVQDQIVHAIKTRDQRRLAATTLANQRGNAVFGNAHVNVVQHMLLTKTQIQVAYFYGRLFRRQAFQVESFPFEQFQHERQ